MNKTDRWWKPKQAPSALQLAVTALEDCRCKQLEHSELSEYHTAMQNMLHQRETRLVADIARLTSASEQSK